MTTARTVTKRGHGEDSRRLDVSLAGEAWFVDRGGYAIVAGRLETTSSGAPLATVRPSADVAAGLSRLRKADDASLLAVVSSIGLLGASLDPETAHRSERVDDVRRALLELETCRRLLDELRLPRPNERRMRRLAAILRPVLSRHGLTEDARRELDSADLTVPAPARRSSLTADLVAAGTLAQCVSFWVENSCNSRLSLMHTRWAIRATPLLVARTPIGLAFLLLFEQLGKVLINRTSSGRRLLRYQLRKCAECGNLFNLTRRDQRYCSKQCRWRAVKRASRATGGRDER